MSNLIETKIIYNYLDFYFDTPIEDKTFLSYYVDRNIGFADDDDYVRVESRHTNRPYVLSYDLYNNDNYYWVFQRMNMDILIDPIRDMKEGIVLRVPTLERIENFMNF